MEDKTSMPLVSVLLLSYNHEKFIERSIRSVFELYSKYYLLELRIIDDGSTDRTTDIINELKVISPIPMYVKFKKHIGISAISSNLNELIFEAEGKYITFLASDDNFSSIGFSERLNILEQNEYIKLVYANGVNVVNGVKAQELLNTDVKTILESNNTKEVYDYLVSGIPTLYIQALIIRKDYLWEVGGFDEELIADDWVLNIKIFKYLYEQDLQYRFINEIAFFRNIHSSNTSSDSNVHLKRIKQVVNKYFEIENRNIVLADLYWLYGRQALKNNNIIKGITFILISQRYSFNIIKRIKKKLKKLL